jgi:signal transduction histidine kinase
MSRLTLRTRIVLWNTTTVGLLLIFLAVVAYLRVEASVYSAIDRTLTSRSATLFGLRDPMGPLHSDAQLLRLKTAEAVQMVTRPRLLRANGASATQYVTDRPWDDAAFRQAIRGRRSVFSDGESEEGPVRVYTRPIVGKGGKVGFVLQHVYLLNQAEAAVNAVKTTFFAVAPLALLAVVLAAIILAQRAAGPIAQMAEDADALSVNSLDTRLNVRGSDEVATLGHAFNRVLDRLQAAFEQQKRVIDSQRNFVADASNELRAPLESIKMSADQALESPNPTPLLENIRRSAGETDELVNQMLAMARAESRLGDYQHHQEIFPLLLDAYERWEPVFGERLMLRASRRLPAVLGDERQLKEVLDNLLQNCARYAPEAAIRLGAEESDGRVKIEVEDDGRGVSPDDLGRIFDRFYRGKTERHVQGAGLGLSICREIIEAHGGTITLNNQPGGGALVTIILPTAVQTAPTN